MYRNSPIGIFKAATQLREQGHEVELFNMYPMYRPRRHLEYTDGNILWKGIPILDFVGYKKCGNYAEEGLSRRFSRIGLPLSELTKKLEEFQPDEIYVGNTFTFLWRSVYEIIAHCKSVYPKGKVVLGGIYPTLCPEHAAKSGADKVVTKSEKAITDSFYHIDADFFSDDMPDRIFLGTSVGCPKQCSYCAIKFIEGCQKVNATPDDIIKEMKYFLGRGVNNFIFLDANVLLGFENHFKIILQRIIDEKLKVKLTNYGGVDAALVNDENIDLMVKAGFTSINLPIEDANDVVLEGWNRRTDAATWLRAVDITKKYIDRVRTFMMIGAPNQTMKGILDTYQYVIDNGVEPYVLPFTPIPKTPMYENYKDMDMEDLNPALYPCAHSNMKVKDLAKLFGQSRLVPFDDLYTEQQIIADIKPMGGYVESGPPIPIKES
jgi:radical SAM superfamily enzyme YgiQ (UPF0313 family)